MLPLVPSWAQHYGEFWRAIRVRNLWFIKLRYFAALILTGFLLTGKYLIDLQFTGTQTTAIIIISFSILSYNLIIHSTRKYVGCEPGSFNCLHLSLIQMILDLLALMILVYYTGLIDSPLYMFFIYHMIIGSLVLPGYIVFIAAAIIPLTFAVLDLMQRSGIIQSHIIKGLYSTGAPHTLIYDIIFIIILALMLNVSAYLANKIAHQLYRREQQIRSTLERLNEAETAKQKYTIGIVHEIKTPMVAVQLILELVLKQFVGPINALVEEKLRRAFIRSEEALQLINNVLRISKLKLLDIELTDSICFNEFLKTILDSFSESARSKSIDIQLIDSTGEDQIIKSDKVLLGLVLSNLISNAIKYVPINGKIRIELDRDKKGIIMEIADNGIGIPEAEISKIFDQFYRASNIDKTVHEGSGLGLSIVKEIVERIGGNIRVESPSKIGEVNKPGTGFIIFLPYFYKPEAYDIFEVNNEDYLKS